MNERKTIIVDTKELVEIFCEVNGLVLNSPELKEKIPMISAIKGRIGDLLNKGLSTEIFTKDIAPFEISFDMLSKILEKGKL
ncbi:MAG TPA: hypothetical protein PLX56_06300 [bacterium]|nr:hypothetical protein [bacterium]HQO91921.1 hypothetical protein [bacterium]